MMYHHDFSELESPVVGENDDEQSMDLLGMLRLPPPLITCCDTLCFTVLTLLLLLDIISDVCMIIVLAVTHDYTYLITSVSVFVCTALVTSVVYAVHMKHDAGHGVLLTLACAIINFPLQAAILGHQLVHTYRKCVSCACAQTQQETHRHTHKTKKECNLRWAFIKLDLIHAVLNNCPQMVINIVHMVVYRNVYFVHYFSITTSFCVLVFSAVMHEKVRKERARNSPYGCLPLMCIILYRAFVFSARIIAFSIFYIYFGYFLCGLLFPHLLVVMAFFSYLYRQVWKVPYRKILFSSVCCIIAYFPIHCEYRPEGEIVIYYIIYLLENILMVGLAFLKQPYMSYGKDYAPWSDFHKTMTAFVLLFSSIGLMFMGTYYFFFHGANETISDTSLGWLAKLFEWTKRTKRNSHRVGLYNIPGSTQSSFSNPLCLDNPPLIAQPQQPIRENVTSPLWSDPPQYRSLYMPASTQDVSTGPQPLTPSLYSQPANAASNHVMHCNGGETNDAGQL